MKKISFCLRIKTVFGGLFRYLLLKEVFNFLSFIFNCTTDTWCPIEDEFMMWLFDISAQHFRRNILTVKPFIKLHYLEGKNLLF